MLGDGLVSLHRDGLEGGGLEFLKFLGKGRWLKVSLTCSSGEELVLEASGTSSAEGNWS